MAFEVLLGGVGDAFSTRHHGTHLLVRKDGFLLGVDCPDTFRHGLKEHRFSEEEEYLDVGDIDAMFITHLHGDHVNGLEMTLAIRTMVLGKEPLPVYGIPEVVERLWPERLKVSLGQMYNGKEYQTVEAGRFMDVRAVTENMSTQIGPFGLELMRTRHHIPTTAMRIRDGESLLAYSCDTAFTPALIDWLEKDADVILHECTFGKAHTQLPDLLSLPASIKSRMVVVHYSDQMIGMGSSELPFGVQGQVLRVG